ncbi:MAG: MBL fold metallo-hydrolase [Candidatus Omnitrophica bacterium]|nr:MBL fold metallo-hydrolase [Candidatus Omnitrophota bacterium]
MKKYFIALVLVGLFFSLPRILFAQDFSAIEIKAIKISESIYIFEGSGGNIGVSVGTDGTLIIDDQFAPLSEKILAAIKNIGGDTPAFVLNTHWHGDHTGGNQEFGKDAHIIAHENVRTLLETRQIIEQFNMVSEPHPKEALPVITFSKDLTLHFNDETIRVIHVPGGHTDGDSVIFFEKAGVVHMGDLFFSGMFPFIDLDHGGNVERFTANVKKILDELPADAIIIPGHGPLSGITELRAYHRMLVATSEIIHTALKEGKTAEDIKQEGVLEEWDEWSTGVLSTDRWIDIAYRSLSRSN